MTIKLLDSEDDVVTIDEGESSNIIIQFTNGGVAIAKNNLTTLKVTLFDRASSTLINARNLQDVLDANNGAVATDGTLTLRLGPLDNIVVSTAMPIGGLEEHIARFTWTWNDGISTRTGQEEVAFDVKKLATPV